MSKKIRLRGIKEEKENSEVRSFKIDLEKGKSETIVPISKGRVRLGVSRDIGGLVELPDMQADDIACVEYANGFKLWTRVDDLYREHAARGTRGVVDVNEDVWEIDPQPRDVGAERGAASLAIEALEFFGVDLKGVAATELCKWFEARQLQKDGPGLYQCRSLLASTFALEKVQGNILEPADKPILMFIHGTGSSSAGGFGKLWSEAQEAGAEARKALQKEYGEACYAFEHRSLTVSPIDNALEIVHALPDNASVHLITHSRGGLVGELLCLGQRDKTTDPLQNELLDTIFNPEKDRTQGELLGLGLDTSENAKPKGYKPECYKNQKEQLQKLLKILDEKHIKVTRFVRVACPARGTTLASGRLDRWLSITQYLSGSNDFIEFLLGVLKERTDPRTLPGLEAMMPGSALVRLLNYPDLKVSADLSVIAGDIEAHSIWSKLKLQLVDWFYDSEHDLVVNTGSMFGGIARQEGTARFFFDQGKDVNHFNYFKNGESVEKLAAGLLRSDSDQAGYKPISLAKHEEPARGIRRAALSSGPLAIVLHGTMGSHLAQDNERIWLDYLALSKGKLPKLGITMPGVVSLGLLNDFYGDFVDYLGASHRVEPFHYDWRLSIIDSAHELSRLVSSHLADCEAKRQPLRFVAHSMGGLVVRAMFTLYPQIWKRFQALQGSRFMMLGTPNAGSYEAVRWLTGWNPTLGKLGWLDIAHDTAGLVNIVNRYPGLLELLPSNDGNNYSNPDLWKAICAGGDKNWPLPQADTLKNLGKAWQLVRDSPIDSERMLYVAGWAPETVSGFQNMSGRGLFSKERPPVRFFSTRKGDGTVPWALGLLPGVKTWYVEEAPHDQLMAYSPAFPAYIDLLHSGATNRLSQDEPGASRAVSFVAGPTVMRDAMPDSMPSEADLSSFVFGAGRPFKRGKMRRLPKVNVSISHGNLAYACHPVCVGHYYGDTIVSAEAYLDSRMDRALSKRVSLGLYPGELNSHIIHLQQDKNAKPNGAIVIGLGRVGELSPGMLASGISQALLDYALKINEWPDDRFGGEGTVRSAKISFLLIGTGFGGMSIRDSIEAILIGVKSVNDRLVETRFDDKVLFDDIEFLELYQDVAINAARELAMILRDGSTLQEHFTWQDHTVKPGPGGLQRVLFEEAPNWWHRLEIVYDKKAQLLRFIALTDRARAEVTLVSGQMRLADKFIASMISTTSNSRALAQTLFEMLIPNPLKELAPDRYDLVLILDEESARYPWELLEDRWGATHKPAAVGAGMLRQLKTQKYRAKPLHSVEKSALVIGNPVIPVGSGGVIFPDLPGAAREAEAVASLLAGNGYDVNKALGRQASNLEAGVILTSLHGEAYRILHLAGHGVHEFEIEKYFPVKENCQACGQDIAPDKKRVSGMVIGDNIFLTPGDVEQMRWVPELVFINCCHLGSTDVRYPEARRYNELAANLGTQFITMGVKAVVAAGWAVDDAAAKAFAESFYQSMLSGTPFGTAVRLARQLIYEQFPDVNTWGAYQCYGDPDFRFFEDTQNHKTPHPSYYAKAEWVSDLENILSTMRSNSSGKEQAEECRQRLANCLQRVPINKLEKWQAQADVAAALGTFYGELGDYDLAIEHLDKAMAANKAEFPVKALEQRANYRVKHALQFRQTADKTEKEQAESEILKAIHELDVLSNMTSTIERYSLLGSAYKRLAWLQNGKTKKKDALKSMCENYKNAFEKGKESGTIDAYPLTNWITAEVVLSWFDNNRDQNWKENLHDLVAKAINAAKQKIAVNPEYWDSVVEPDCLLMMGLINGEYKAEDIKRIVEGYRLATERGASEKDKAALREHIEFLIFMAEQVKPKQNELWKCLQVIFRQLA